MGEMPLSLKLGEETIAALRREADLRGVSADEVADQAINAYVEAWKLERDLLRKRAAEADRGIFISEEAMTRWIESWGSENELPPPEPDIFPDK